MFACIGFFTVCIPFRISVLFTNLHKFSIFSYCLPFNPSLDPWSNVSLTVSHKEKRLLFSFPVSISAIYCCKNLVFWGQHVYSGHLSINYFWVENLSCFEKKYQLPIQAFEYGQSPKVRYF